MEQLTHPKEKHLRKQTQFKNCYENGQRLFSNHFIVLFLSRVPGDQKGVRLGTAVSKKIGNAVKRNRVKRLIREFFRHHQHIINKDIDLVVVAKRSLQPSKISYWLLERELRPLFEKIQKENFCFNHKT